MVKKLMACLSPLTVSSAASISASAQQVQVAFSPVKSLPLVLSVISNSCPALDIAACSSTSKDISLAIHDGQKRGVKVRVVADKNPSYTTSSWPLTTVQLRPVHLITHQGQ